MAFENRDRRAAVIGTLLFPMHPEPDGGVLTKFDRIMITGVYPIDVPWEPPVESITALCGVITTEPGYSNTIITEPEMSNTIIVGTC